MNYIRAGNDHGNADQRSDGSNDRGGGKHTDNATGNQQDTENQRNPPVAAKGCVCLKVPDVIAQFPDAQGMADAQAGSHMIVDFDVTNSSSNRGTLNQAAEKCKQEIGLDSVRVIADKGYESIADIEELQHTPIRLDDNADFSLLLQEIEHH